MSNEVLGYIVTALVAVLGAVGSLIGKFLLDAIRDHIKATKDNTTALAILDNEIKNIMKNSDQIPELTKDLNAYFVRLKSVEAKLEEKHGK